MNPSSKAPRDRTLPYYCGVSADIEFAFIDPDWFLAWLTGLGFMAVIDVPFSFAADTLMLPRTIYVEYKYHKPPDVNP